MKKFIIYILILLSLQNFKCFKIDKANLGISTLCLTSVCGVFHINKYIGSALGKKTLSESKYKNILSHRNKIFVANCTISIGELVGLVKFLRSLP